MSRRTLAGLVFFFIICAQAAHVRAQDAPPPPPEAEAGRALAAVEAPLADLPLLFAQGGNYLGVHVEDVTAENMGRYGLTGEPRGVAVTQVIKDGPAERAGIRENDVIVRYDDEEVTNFRRLSRLLAESSPQHTARLTVRRGGSQQEVSVKLGAHPGFGVRAFGGTPLAPGQVDELQRRARELAEQYRHQGEDARRQSEQMRKQLEEMRRNNPNLFQGDGGFAVTLGGGRRIGVGTSTLTKQLADFFGARDGGVLVNTVEDNSPADRAGLRAGDVITEIDGERIDGAGDITRALSRKSDGDVTLTVVRERKQRQIRVTPERRQSSGLLPVTPGVTVVPRALTMPRVYGLVAPRVPSAPRGVTVRPTLPTTPAPRRSGRIL